MIGETERFIEYGLAHPELIIEIPAKPVDEQGWPDKTGAWFWDVVLTGRPSGETLRWREFFRKKPTQFLGFRKRKATDASEDE